MLHFSIDWLWPRRLRSWPLQAEAIAGSSGSRCRCKILSFCDAAEAPLLPVAPNRFRQRQIAACSCESQALPAVTNLKLCVAERQVAVAGKGMPLPAAAAAAAVRSCLSAMQLQHRCCRQRRIAAGSGESQALPAVANLKLCVAERQVAVAGKGILRASSSEPNPALLVRSFFILKLISGFIDFEEERLSHNPHLFSVIQV